MSTVGGGCQSSWQLVARDNPLKLAKAAAGGQGFWLNGYRHIWWNFRVEKGGQVSQGTGTWSWTARQNQDHSSVRLLLCHWDSFLSVLLSVLLPSFFLPAVSPHFPLPTEPTLLPQPFNYITSSFRLPAEDFKSEILNCPINKILVRVNLIGLVSVRCPPLVYKQLWPRGYGQVRLTDLSVGIRIVKEKLWTGQEDCPLCLIW